jgi:hypothetical protein
VLERVLEGGLRLVASELGDGAGRQFRSKDMAANLPTRDTTAMPLSAESSRSTEVKTQLLAGATLALLPAWAPRAARRATCRIAKIQSRH